MRLNDMSGRKDLPHDVGVERGPLTEDEEGRPDAMPAEQPEHPPGADRIGTVVERKGYFPRHDLDPSTGSKPFCKSSCVAPDSRGFR